MMGGPSGMMGGSNGMMGGPGGFGLGGSLLGTLLLIALLSAAVWVAYKLLSGRDADAARPEGGAGRGAPAGAFCPGGDRLRGVRTVPQDLAGKSGPGELRGFRTRCQGAPDVRRRPQTARPGRGSLSG